MWSQVSRYEKNNVITHAVGIVLSLIGIPILIKFASAQNSPNWELGVFAFCFGLLVVYITSTSYHLAIEAKKKVFFQKLDHIAIYFLIVGTYTSYLLRFLNTDLGHKFLIAQWIIVAIASVFKMYFVGRFETFSLVLYVALGCSVLLIYQPFFSNVDEISNIWLMAGGAFYLIGIIFFVWEKHEINHAIWHLFVLAGSGSHYMGMLHAYSS